MKSFVLDASVAAKWYLPKEGEPLVDEAYAVLAECLAGRWRLTVPDLFWVETTSIFRKAVRQQRIDRDFARTAIGELTRLHLTTVSSMGLVADAFEIAAAFDRSVYDSLYVVLAVQMDRPLITADERLANAVAAHLPVRWLGSLPL